MVLPLFCYLLNVCVNYAWLFARAGDYADNMLAFTRSIVQCWLTKYGIPATNPGRQIFSATFLNRTAQFDQIGHYMEKSDPQVRNRYASIAAAKLYL